MGTVVLQNDGAHDLTVSADGSYPISTGMRGLEAYNISVLRQPAGQVCSSPAGPRFMPFSGDAYETVTCAAANPSLSVSGIETKRLRFGWSDVAGESEYRLLEDRDGSSSFSVISVLNADSEQADIEIYVPDFLDARYKLQACDDIECRDSEVITVAAALNDAVGYFKPLDPDIDDSFGGYYQAFGAIRRNPTPGLVLSGDGSTLAVGAPWDDSGDTGVGSSAANDSATDSGAVYVLTRTDVGTWERQAYIKAPNSEAADEFGSAISLSADGSVLAISSILEDSAAIGTDGDQANNSAADSGAVYVYSRDDTGAWNFDAYLKAANTTAGDHFGGAVTLSGDGKWLAVGAYNEGSNASGINGDSGNDLAPASGAVYVFRRNELDGSWIQQAYLKASNSEMDDLFGWSAQMDGTGEVLVIGAFGEDSAAAGINGTQGDNTQGESGAAYVFTRNATDIWSQRAYIKASNPGSSDVFGYSVALADDGRTLAVGAPNESSAAVGIDGNQLDNSFQSSGAVYVFVDDGGGSWRQQAYLKASNTDSADIFGTAITVSADGSLLLVGAPWEDSHAIGIDGDELSGAAPSSGAVYAFRRDQTNLWTQQSYIKAPNSDEGDEFGASLAVTAAGDALAVGAPKEDSASPSGQDRFDNSIENVGAVYLY
jgi:hypothetical protein